MSRSAPPLFTRLNQYTALICITGAWLLANIILPALPVIGQSLHASIGAIQRANLSFFFSFSIMGILSGYLADRLPRRSLLFCALAVAFLGTLLIRVYPNITCFFISRILQGMGLATLAIVAKATLTTHYHDSNLDHMMTKMVAAIACGTLTAPLIGGWITYLSYWQTIYTFSLLGIGILIALCYLAFPETQPHTADHKPESSLGHLFTYPTFMSMLAINSLFFSIIMAANSSLPFMLTLSYQLHQSSIGYLVALPNGGFLLGALLCGLFIKRYLASTLLLWAITSILFLGASLILMAITPFMLLILLGLILFTYGLCDGFLDSTTHSIALYAIPTRAQGMGAALITVIPVLVGSVLTSLLTFLSLHTTLVLGWIFLINGILMLIVYCIWFSWNKRQHT